MTYQPSICVITPTVGRPTLRRTLESGIADLNSNDFWIVFGDGPQPKALEICQQLEFDRFKCRVAFLETIAPLGDYGNPLRDRGMSIANQDYFIFLDWDNGGGHRSDFNFIEQTLKLYGPGWRQNLFWSGDVIVHCRPEV